MAVTEILQWADHLVFAKKKTHLNDLQESTIKGLWKGQSYQEIADESGRRESRVRNVASQLLQFLSTELGEDIKQGNFQSTFNRLQITSSPTQNICNVTGRNNNSFNYNPLILYNSPEEHQKNDTNTQSKSVDHDLKLAPQIMNFYNRESELNNLSNYIFNQNTPLISVLGLSGIGKSYLVRKFIALNLDKFKVIIWRSLKYPKSLELMINDLLEVCQIEIKEILDDKLKQFFDILNKKKCLIILDDVQKIFISGDLAGKYKPEYKDYQKFFTMITETEHQSNIILISQEKCGEMNCLDQQLYPIKSLELLGLNDINLLDNTGLNNQDSWLKLIQLYEGNPAYLKDITSLIQDVYDGEVTDFLAENSLIITQNMQSNFNDLFNRLSPIEQQIILELSKLEQPRSREDLKQNLALSSVDFVKGLQSLQQRYLVRKIKEDKILFKLSPVFREYVINCEQN